MARLALRLACLAFACSPMLGLSAQAQNELSMSAVEVSNGCMDVMITNHTDHQYDVTISYHYSGLSASGQPTTYDWTARTGVDPFATTYAWTGSFGGTGLVDCKKKYQFTFHSNYVDLTAAYLRSQQQKQQATDDLERLAAAQRAQLAEQKRVAEADKAQKEAQAAQRAADQKAARDRALQASRDAQQQQENQRRREAAAIIDNGDPRCRVLNQDLTAYYSCKRRVDEQDSRERAAKADQLRREAEAQAQAEQRRQRYASLESAMDSETCVAPDPSGLAVNATERAQFQQALAQAAQHCQQLALGRNAAAQRAQAEMLAAQQQQQMMLEAQQQAERQREAQAALNDLSTGISDLNASTWQESNSIQQSNAELEAWLNAN